MELLVFAVVGIGLVWWFRSRRKTPPHPAVGYPEGVNLMIEILAPITERYPGLNFQQMLVMAQEDPRVGAIAAASKALVFTMTEVVTSHPALPILALAILEDIERKVPNATASQRLALAMADKRTGDIASDLRAPLFAFVAQWPREHRPKSA